MRAEPTSEDPGFNRVGGLTVGTVLAWRRSCEQRRLFADAGLALADRRAQWRVDEGLELRRRNGFSWQWWRSHTIGIGRASVFVHCGATHCERTPRTCSKSIVQRLCGCWLWVCWSDALAAREDGFRTRLVGRADETWCVCFCADGVEPWLLASRQV